MYRFREHLRDVERNDKDASLFKGRDWWINLKYLFCWFTGTRSCAWHKRFMEFEIHGIWDSWNLNSMRFMEFEIHGIWISWDSWNLRFMEFEFHEIHGIWKGALVPLLISLCLFCRFLSLIAIDKKNNIHFVQRPFPLVIRRASDIFSRERILLLSISFSPGAKHCNRLTRRYLNVN